MLARRMLLLLSIVLLAAALGSAISDSGRQEDDAPVVTPQASAPEQRVTGRLPADRRVTAEVGDVVELAIRASQADRAEIRGLGVDVAVGPGLDGRLLVVVDRAGTYPVTLRYSGRRIGTLAVDDR